MTRSPLTLAARHSRIALLAPFAALALAVGTVTVAAVAPAAAATSMSGNLLVDSGAEAVAQCTTTGEDGMTVPGWTITGGEPNAVCYGAPGGYPDANTPGAPGRGNQFFDGGATGNSGLSQTADVSAAAGTIDAGGVPFNLSGWLGGYSSQNDRVGLTATFQDGSGKALGTASIPAVTNSDRGDTTEFLQRSATGALPAGTRSVKVALAFTWTVGDTTDGYADNLSLTIGAQVPTPALTAPASAVPGFDHVFMVYMENQDYSGIIGNSSAPYINSLIPKATVLTQSYATTHPSDPNYVALAGGGLYGLHDNSIGTTTINAPHVGNSVEAAGKTWKAYVENANGNCDYTSHGYYAPDDVPFTYFQNFKADESATGYCGRHDQPLTQMAADLKSAATTPNFVWFEPDDCDDMESCGVAAGDTWLSKTLPTIFNSPAWTQQRSLLILTFDEGATKAYGPSYPNQVPTLLLGSPGTVNTGYYSSQRTDQYGLLRTVDKALGLAPLTNNDAYAATVDDAWSGTSGGVTTSSLTTSTPSVANGSSITFSYATPAATNSTKNWVGFYKPGDTPGSQPSTAWQYTPGTSGSVTFTADYGAGTYNVYYFSNDGYTVLAGPVTVTLT